MGRCCVELHYGTVLGMNFSVCKQSHSAIGDDTDLVLRITLNRPMN